MVNITRTASSGTPLPSPLLVALESFPFHSENRPYYENSLIQPLRPEKGLNLPLSTVGLTWPKYRRRARFLQHATIPTGLLPAHQAARARHRPEPPPAMPGAGDCLQEQGVRDAGGRQDLQVAAL
jgi:hypothetical protein